MKFKTEPYKHQLTAYNRFRDAEFFALFAEQGTGKTKIIIDIASFLSTIDKIDAVLLIAPNGVHAQWVTEQLPIHSPIEYTPHIFDSKRYNTNKYQLAIKEFLNKPSELKWFTVNVEYFSTAALYHIFEAFLKEHRTLMVIDEATRIKNPDAARTKNILKLSRLAERRAILTGTPIAGSPFNMWSMFEFLKRDFWDCNYFIFKHRYGLFMQDVNQRTGKSFARIMTIKDIEMIKDMLKREYDYERISAYTGLSEKNIKYIQDNQNQFNGYKNLDRLKKTVEPHAFYITKAECLDLPDKIYETLYVEPSAEQKKLYKDLTKSYLALYAEKELTVTNKISLLVRLQQITSGFFPVPDENKLLPIGSKNVKVERVVSDLEEIGDESVVVWGRFVAEIEAVAARIAEVHQWPVVSYYGKTSKEDRLKNIDDFKQGRAKVIVFNVNSNAVFGHNLQISNLHYYLSNTDSYENRAQSEDRSHRSGQKWPVVYKDVVMVGTADEKIAENLKNKKSMLEYFRDTSIEDILTYKE